MSVRGRRSIIIGIVGCVALGVLVVATRGHAAPPSPAPLYSYPPNARQLIAAGLTGRPVGQNLSGPATIDLLRDAETIVWTRRARRLGRGRVVPYAVGERAKHLRPVLCVT